MWREVATRSHVGPLPSFHQAVVEACGRLHIPPGPVLAVVVVVLVVVVVVFAEGSRKRGSAVVHGGVGPMNLGSASAGWTGLAQSGWLAGRQVPVKCEHPGPATVYLDIRDTVR